MQGLTLLKTVEVADVDQQQTLVVLPAAFLKQFSPEHRVSFQELAMDVMLVSMVGPGQASENKAYKLVPANGAHWISVPRWWLRNVGAEPGDQLLLYTTENPDELLLHYRPKFSLP